MPNAPKKHRPKGYKSPEQKKVEYDKTRPSSAKRGYGANWRKLRTMVLARDPICKAPGCNEPATDVDHILPKLRGGADSLDNLQGLCHRCHSTKTAKEDGRWG